MFIARFMGVLLTTLTCANAAHAGAWLQDQGHGLAIVQASYFTDSDYFDRDGSLHKQPTYAKYELQPYVEYGLFSNLTIGGTLFLQNDNQSGISNSGVADPSLFVRTTLWKDAKQVVSIQPLVKFESSFLYAGSPRGGSESTDGELSLLYGRNVTIVSSRDYLDVDTGYRYRSGALNDQYHANIALGLSPAPNWQFVPAFRATLATKIPSTMAFSENGDQDYDLYKIELGAFYHLSGTQTVGLTLFDLIDGRQTGNGAGATISFGQAF